MVRTFDRSRLLRGLRSSTALIVSLAGLAAVSYPQVSLAGDVLPQNGTVVVGAATIAQPSANALNVTTSTNHTAINWQSFSIGGGDTVTITQPGASSLTLNEVTGPSASSIFGSLKSNGQVVLANPNGIWFGPNAHVDVASIVASTATASRAALAAFAAGGKLLLDTPGLANASVVNDGSISVADEGLAALVAPGVANHGLISARLGQVVLASGTTATLDFYGDGLISFAVGGSVTALAQDHAGHLLAAAVTNSGKIAAHGGSVLLTAAAAKTIVDNTINMSGVVQASAIDQQGGDIDLEGGSGTTSVSGTLEASSKTARGGTITVTGNAVQLASTANIAANGTGGGTIAIGGGVHGGGSVAHALSVAVAQGATISADGSAGAGGTISVWSDGATQVAASITAVGALPGGFVETSGHTLDFGGISVKASQWLLDPVSLELTQSDQNTISGVLNDGTSVSLATAASGNPTGGYGTPNSDETAGDIIVDAAGTTDPNGISWSTSTTFTLNAYGQIKIAAGAKIENTGSASIYLDSGSGVSLAAGGIVSTTNGGINADDTLTSGSVGSTYAGTLSAYDVSLSDGASLALTGTVDFGSQAYLVAPSVTIDGNLSGSASYGAAYLEGSSSLAVGAGALISAGSGTITDNYFYYYELNYPVTDIEGTLAAGYINFLTTDLTIGAAASLAATYSESFSATSGFTLSSGSAQVINTPSLTISEGANPIGIGGTSINGDLNLTPAALTQLGYGSATGLSSLFSVIDTETSFGSITTSGSLSFPGSVSLVQGSGATLSVGGTLTYAGNGRFGNSTGDLAITGNVTQTTGAYLSLVAGGSLDLAGSVSNTGGYIYISDTSGSSSPGTVIDGAISAYGVNIADSGAVAIGSSANIMATNYVSLSAGTSLSLPSTGSTVLVTAPSLSITYAGGAIEIGGAAVTGDLNLTPTVLTELGYGSTTSTDSLFSVNDTASSGGSITVSGTLSFPGEVSLQAGSGSALDLDGTITVGTYGYFNAPSGNLLVDGTVSDTSTYAYLSLAAGGSLEIAETGVLRDSYEIYMNNTGSGDTTGTIIDGTISGTYASIIDGYGITLASTASVTGTGYVSLSAASSFVVPTSGSSVLVATPSLLISYGGGAIQIGGAAVTGDLNLTPAVLAELGYGSSGDLSSLFEVYDTATSNGSLTTSGTLTFPGSLSLIAGTGATLTLGGTLSFDGAASFNTNSPYYYYYGEYDGSIDITGSLVDTAPSASDASVSLDAGGNLSLAATGSVSNPYGSVTFYNYPYTSTTSTAIDGTISGKNVSISDNYSLALNPVSITATGYLLISVGGSTGTLDLPSGSSAVVSTPSLTISYAGGPVDLGGSGVEGDLNITTGVLTALGYGSASGLSGLFELITSSNTAPITTSGTLDFPGSVYLIAGGSLTIGGPLSLDGTGSFESAYEYTSGTSGLLIDGSISDRGTGALYFEAAYGGSLALAQGVSISAGSSSTIGLSAYDYYNDGSVSIAGSLTGGSVDIGAYAVTLASTASLNAATIVLSAQSSYAFPTTSAQIVSGVQSLSIYYDGGPVQLGSATDVSGDLNLTPTVLTDLGAFSATGGFALVDQASGGSITTSGTLTFAGGLSLEAGYSAGMTLGGVISFNGPGTFTYYSYDGGEIDISGKLIDTAPSGNTTGSITVSGASTLLLEAAGSISDPYGTISLSTYTYDVSGAGTTIDGTITGKTVSISDSHSLILDPVLISAGTAYFDASGTLQLPSGSTPVITAPSLTIDYGDGAIGLGTTAPGSTGTPLEITAANLTALGLDQDGGSGTGLFALSNSSSTNASIAIAAGLTFYGGLTLSITGYSDNAATIDVGGNLTVSGAVVLSAYDYYDTATVDIAGTITAGSFSISDYYYDYSQSIILTGNTTINTSGDNGTISMGGVDGAYNLTLNAGSGTLTLGTVGGTTHLDSLSITAGGVTLPAITITGNLFVSTAQGTSIENLITVIGGGSTVLDSDTAGSYGYGDSSLLFYSGYLLNTTGSVTISYHPGYYEAVDSGESYFSSYVSEPVQSTLLVDTATDLEDVGYDDNYSAHYALNNNISLTGSYYSPIGSSATPFTGIFDGDGHTITGLIITQESGSLTGLFGKIGAGGVVDDLGLVGATINGEYDVGALAGSNLGTLAGVYSTGVVSGTTGVGGLVGDNAGLIINSYSTAEVAIADGGTNAGGLVGQNDSTGSVASSFAAGNISYTTNEASFGGLVGLNSGTISGSYWDTDTTGILTAESGATGETTAEFTSSLAANLSSDVWGFTSGSLPYLLFQSGPVTTPLAANQDSVSGTVLTGYNGSDIADAKVDLVVDGVAVGNDSTNSDGLYTIEFASSLLTSSGATHLVTAYLDPSDSYAGSTSEDRLSFGTPVTGIDIYENFARVVTAQTTLSAIASEIAADDANIPSSALLLTLTTGQSSSVSATGTGGIAIHPTGTSFDIDEALSATNQVVLNASSATSEVTQSAPISAANLYLNGSNTYFYLTNASNAISAVGVGPITTSVGSVSLVDSVALTIGSVASSYVQEYTAPAISIIGPVTASDDYLELFTQSLTFGNGTAPTISVSEIELGTSVSGGTIAIGSDLGAPSASTLVLSAALLNELGGSATPLVIGNAGVTVDIGTLSLTSSANTIFEGSSISVSGALSAPTGSVEFYANSGGTITIASGASVTADGISSTYYSDTAVTILVDGSLSATSQSVDLSAGTSGSIAISSGVEVSGSDGVYLSGSIIDVAGTVAAGSGHVEISTAANGLFTEASTGTITGEYIGIYVYNDDEEAQLGYTANIDGGLYATYSLSVETGTGGVLTLGDSNGDPVVLSVASSSDYYDTITINTDSLNVPTPTDVSVEGGNVSVDQGYPTNSSVISVGTDTINGALNLTSSILSVFANTAHVTIGNTSNTQLTVQGISLGSNYTLNAAYETVSGSAYSASGSALDFAALGLIIQDGDSSYSATTTASDNGTYSFSFNPNTYGLNGGSRELEVYITTAGEQGVALEDNAPLTLTNFNVYANTVAITTESTSLSAALSALHGVADALPTADQLLTVSDGAAQSVSNTSLLLTGEGTDFVVDDTISTGTGALTVTAGSLTVAAAVTAAGAVSLSATSALIVNASIVSSGNQSFTAPALSFGEGVSLDSGAAVAFRTNSLGLPASLTDASGVSFDSYTSGATIGLGDAAETISLSQADLTFLGANLTIGDVASTVVIGSTSQSVLTLPGSITIDATDVSVYGMVSLSGTGAAFNVDVYPATSYHGSSFTLQPGGVINAPTIDIDPATLTISGALDATSGGLILETGSGGSVVLNSGASIATTGALSFDTDNLVLSGSGATPTITATSIDIVSYSPVELGSSGGSGFSAAALALFSGIPVTITAPSASLASGYTLPADFTVVQTGSGETTYTISGTAFSAYGGSALGSGIQIDLLFDGSQFIPATNVTTNSAGEFSFEVTSNNNTTHDLAVYFDSTSELSGVAFYVGPDLTQTSFNLYENTVAITTTAATLSSTLSSISGEIALLPTGDQLQVGEGVVTTPSNLSLLVAAGSASTLTIDDTVDTGTGSLVLDGDGGIINQSATITTPHLELDGTGTFTLTNTSNNIGTLQNATANTDFTALTLADADTAGLTIGTLTATGAVTIDSNAVALGTGATVTAGGGITLDTLNVGGSIGLGSATGGTLSISSALLTSLGSNSALTIGDGSNTITVAGTLAAAQSLTLDGAAINISGSVTLSGTDAVFDATGSTTGTFTLASGGSITASTITIDPETINVDGTLDGSSGITLTTSSGGSVNLNSGSEEVSTGTLAVNTDAFTVASSTINVAKIVINGETNSTPIAIGTISGAVETGIVLTANTLAALGTTTPITIGTVSSEVTIGTPAILTAYTNVTIPALQFSIAGTAYSAYGSTTALNSGSVEIVYNGNEVTTSIGSNGAYSALFLNGVSSREEVAIILTSGGTGSAFYDLATSMNTGLDVYAGSVLVETDSGSLTSAVSNLSNAISALGNTSSLDGLGSFASNGIATSSLGLVIDAASGAALALDVPVASGSGTLTLAGTGTITQGTNAISASTLDLSGTGTFVLANASNAIGTVADAPGSTDISALTLDDNTALTIGSLNASGKVSISDNNLSVASGAVIAVAGGITVDTLNAGGAIDIGTATGGALTLSSNFLNDLGGTSDVIIGDGSNAITADGTINVPGGVTLNGAVTLAGNTEIDAETRQAGSSAYTYAPGNIYFEGTVTPGNSAVTLTLGTGGNIYFAQNVGSEALRLADMIVTNAENFTAANAGGSLTVTTPVTNVTQTITETATIDPLTGQVSTIDAQLWVGAFNTGGYAIYNSTGYLVSYVAGVTGTLSVGLHSLESDGDVSIFATTVDGRIVAGSTGATSADTGPATSANLVVASNNITDSDLVATRSANVGATVNIGNSYVSSNVATITATNVTNTTVTVTQSANVSASQSITDSTINNTSGGTVNVNTQNLSGDTINDPQPQNVILNGGNPDQGNNTLNGQPITSAVVQLASLEVPTNATNPQVSSPASDESASGGDLSGGTGAGGKKKEKGEKSGKAGVQSAAAKAKTPSAKTYDAANQFLNNLLTGKK